MVIPLFKRIKNDEILNTTSGLELKTIVLGAAMIKMNDNDFWNAISKRLLENKGLETLNTFDKTSMMYGIGLVKYHNKKLLDEISSCLIKDEKSTSNLGTLGISNCFIAIGNLK